MMLTRLRDARLRGLVSHFALSQLRRVEQALSTDDTIERVAVGLDSPEQVVLDSDVCGPQQLDAVMRVTRSSDIRIVGVHTLNGHSAATIAFAATSPASNITEVYLAHTDL